jgi:hypothetical protein
MTEAALDDYFKTASEMDNWIEKSPYEMSCENSPFAERFGKTFYANVEKTKYKPERFSNAMKGASLSMSGRCLNLACTNPILQPTTICLSYATASTGNLLRTKKLSTLVEEMDTSALTSRE